MGCSNQTPVSEAQIKNYQLIGQTNQAQALTIIPKIKQFPSKQSLHIEDKQNSLFPNKKLKKELPPVKIFIKKKPSLESPQLQNNFESIQRLKDSEQYEVQQNHAQSCEKGDDGDDDDDDAKKSQTHSNNSSSQNNCGGRLACGGQLVCGGGGEDKVEKNSQINEINDSHCGGGNACGGGGTAQSNCGGGINEVEGANSSSNNETCGGGGCGGGGSSCGGGGSSCGGGGSSCGGGGSSCGGGGSSCGGGGGSSD